MSYKVHFLNVVKFLWKLQFDDIIFFEFSQACPKCSEKKLAIQILKTNLVHQCNFLQFFFKPHGCKKCSSCVVTENALDRSDCIIFWILISLKLFEVESLLFACHKISMEAAVWSWSFFWVWSCMLGIPIVL